MARCTGILDCPSPDSPTTDVESEGSTTSGPSDPLSDGLAVNAKFLAAQMACCIGIPSPVSPTTGVEGQRSTTAGPSDPLSDGLAVNFEKHQADFKRIFEKV